jgi:hypothetical protein
MRRGPSAYGSRTSGPSTASRTSRRPRRPTSSNRATPKKRGAFGAGIPNASEKCSAFGRGVPQARGAPIPPLPPPSIPWPWRCWWRRCRSSPPGDFLPLPTFTYCCNPRNDCSATALGSCRPVLPACHAASPYSDGRQRSTAATDAGASPQALQPAQPRPLAPLPVPSHLNP